MKGTHPDEGDAEEAAEEGAVEGPHEAGVGLEAFSLPLGVEEALEQVAVILGPHLEEVWLVDLGILVGLADEGTLPEKEGDTAGPSERILHSIFIKITTS